MSERLDFSKFSYRPLNEEDAPALQEMHGTLSPDTVYLRFCGAKPVLRYAEALYLASVDHTDREAIAAVHKNASGEHIVGVARYDRLKDPEEAEFAVVIQDDQHHHGLGTELTNRLIISANNNDIRRFKSERLWSNRGVAGLLRKVCGDPVGKAQPAGSAVVEMWTLPDLQPRNG